MINTNSLDILGQFYFNIKEGFKSIYQNSNFYEKKISKTFDNNFEYKPSPHLLSSIIKYQNKKFKIEDFAINSIWQNNLSPKSLNYLSNLLKYDSVLFCTPHELRKWKVWKKSFQMSCTRDFCNKNFFL